MVCFQTKNPNLIKFWRVLQWTVMVYFIDTWSILGSFVLVYGQWVQFVVIWYIFSRFGILCQEKSLVKLHKHTTVAAENSSMYINLGNFCNLGTYRKTVQRQQSPNGRKSAQSGHPGVDLNLVFNEPAHKVRRFEHLEPGS
jgi:hypothetical protein